MFLIVRYGKSCASTCGKGDNDYHWCWVGWHLEDVILIYLSSPCSYGSEQRISYLLLALCDFRTGSTAHQWVKPDMGRLVLETALRGGRITGDVFFLNVNHLARARWCYTDKEEKEWEYCSPPGEVSSFQTYIPLLLGHWYEIMALYYVKSILTEISASRRDRRVLQKSKIIRIEFLSKWGMLQTSRYV